MNIEAPVSHGGNTDVKRDRFGRPLVWNSGKYTAYQRCTTFVKAVEDTYHLSLWQQRMVAIGVSSRSDIALKIASTDLSDKAGLDRLTAAAMDAAGAYAGASIGTTIHELTEKLDQGEPVSLESLPDGVRDMLMEYQKIMSHFDVRAVETFRVNNEFNVAGTADRLVLVDGKLTVFDIKTGSLRYPGSMAMQLAMYAHSQPYDPVKEKYTKDSHPMNLDYGVIVHFDQDKNYVSCHRVDLRAGWEACRIAKDVWEWRTRSRPSRERTPLLWSFSHLDMSALAEPHPDTKNATPSEPPAVNIADEDPVTPGSIEECLSWEDRIKVAESVEELRVLWSEITSQGISTNLVTDACKARQFIIQQKEK